MAQARNHFLLPIRQVEKAVWKGNKARAWPNVLLWPTNMHLPNEATGIVDLLGIYSRYATQKARASTHATAMAVARGNVTIILATARY
jgi:hypothetical protein